MISDLAAAQVNETLFSSKMQAPTVTTTEWLVKLAVKIA